ncbi:MAG: glycosyltransferase family 87 protein [Rhizomicrobium sp.]
MRVSSAKTGFDTATLCFVIAGAFVLSYIAVFAIWIFQHLWIWDAQGKPIFTDFVAIWTSGKLALQGAALKAYDGATLHGAEAVAIGHNFQGYLGWPYPPTFFFIAAPLGAMPYAVALLLWVFSTLAIYAAVISKIAQTRTAILLACAAPWVAADITIGQNGFFTAALIGGVLLTMDEMPLLSGIFLGLLTYKPQFGLLFPIALLADRRWTVLLSATVTASTLLALSGVVFGFATFTAFLHNLPQTTQALLVEGGTGWNKLQSVYGLTRWSGGSDNLARFAQAAISFSCAAGIFWLWRSDAPFPRKAAALATASLLVTPYVFFYDFPVLAVAAAWLYREREFDGKEMGMLAGGFLFSLATAAFAVPFALLSTLLVIGIVVRRSLPHSAVDIALQHG